MLGKSLLTRRLVSNVEISWRWKGTSSNNWIQRQASDPYVEKAKMSNYRCRSCFKLLEIDQKHKILKPGYVVIDVGAAPGSWSQVCVRAVNADAIDKNKPVGAVIGIDKLQIYPVEGASFLGNADFTSPSTQIRVRTMMNNRKANCVLSDMAPNATGIRALDQEIIMQLAFSVLHFAKEVSAPNGVLLIKVWENGEVHKLEQAILENYETCRAVKPNASRSDSAEKFILAKGFKKKLS